MTSRHDLAGRWPLEGGHDVRDALIAAWGDPARGYHDLRHLAEVLDRVDALAPSVPGADLLAVRLAAWFHDGVHDGVAGEDEERSAAWAEQALPALGVPPARVAEVARLVRLTAGHRVAPGDDAGALLADADLGILAAGEERYAEYAADVRREYAHVPDELFRPGRAAVLRALLDQRPLFRTPGAAAWESPARANVERELARLV